MIGSFLTRGLVMLFGYAYPAYECFKTVEKNKPDVEELRFWCQYWILVAMLTVFERVGDNFVSWVPMYSEGKLAFVIFLWCPKTKGTTYVYDSFFKPYMAKHETEIDRNLLELRTRAGQMAVTYCQKAASYGQTRVFEVLQYIAAQSTPRPSRAQQQVPRVSQPPAAVAPGPKPPPAAPQPSIKSPTSQVRIEEPASTTSSASSSQQEKDVGPEISSTRARGPSTSAPSALAPAPAPVLAAPAAIAPVKKSVTLPAASESSSQSATNDVEEVEKGLSNASAPPEETVMEEAMRVTRARLRKTRSELTR